MSLATRPATEADLPALVALAEAAYALYIPRLGGREPLAMRPDFVSHLAEGEVLVLEREGGLAAYLIAFDDGDGWMLDNLAVSAAHQGRGIGRQLVALAEEQARAAGKPVLRLYTNVVMTENQALYRRLGFRETGRTEVSGMHRIHYEKPLD